MDRGINLYMYDKMGRGDIIEPVMTMITVSLKFIQIFTERKNVGNGCLGKKALEFELRGLLATRQ